MKDLFIKKHNFSLHRTLNVGLELCDVFLSCLDSDSDGTHSLGEQVM